MTSIPGFFIVFVISYRDKTAKSFHLSLFYLQLLYSCRGKTAKSFHLSLFYLQPPKRMWTGIFKPNSQNIESLKLAYLQNYIADSNKILQNDKDHQVLFVGVHTPNKSKIADGRHFEKSTNRHISAIVWPIVKKFDKMTRVDYLNPIGRWIIITIWILLCHPDCCWSLT